MKIRKPILVTGSHRSGSTWTGRMISLSPDVGFIWEPFNLTTRKGVCSAPFENWFTYVTKENEALYKSAMQDTLQFRYKPIESLRHLKHPIEVLKTANDYFRFKRYELRGFRPLLKDPIAIMSVDWLYKTFDCDVVILIRHPAAFIRSLIMYKMVHPFSDFTNQHRLMNDLLLEFKGDIIRESEFSGEPSREVMIRQSILLWNIIHSVILRYKKNCPGFYFARHEDLSLNPKGEFKKMYDYLGLEFTQSVQDGINQMTQGKKKKISKSGQVSGVFRDSRKNLKSWLGYFSDDELAMIRKGTAAIADQFYEDHEWR